MSENAKNKSMATLVVLFAVLIALGLIGIWTDAFGLFGNEMAPGTTTPPNNTS